MNQSSKKRSKIALKAPRSEDPPLIFDPREKDAVIKYSKKMITYIVPFQVQNMLEHITLFNKFLSALYKDENVVHKIQSFIRCLHYENNNENNGEFESVNKWFMNIDISKNKPNFIVSDDDNDDEDKEDIMYEEEEEEIVMKPINTVNYQTVCDIGWKWYNHIKTTKEVFTSYFAQSYYLIWIAFCRTFFLNSIMNKKNDTNFLMSAMDYKFIKEIHTNHFVVVCGKPIMKYSLNEIWLAITLIIPKLYKFTYTTHMRDYVYRLFLRYCHIVSIPCHSKDEEYMLLDNVLFFHYNDEEEASKKKINLFVNTGIKEDEEEEEDDDDDDGEDEFEAYKEKCHLRMNKIYSIRSDFGFEVELILYHQLRRLDLAYKLSMMAKDNPIPFKDYVSLGENVVLAKMCLSAWKEFLCIVSIDPQIRQMIKESFNNDVMHLFLYHGEKEKFIRNFPGSNHQPGDIIKQTRSHDFSKLQKLRKIVIKSISTQYYNTFIEYLNKLLTKDKEEFDNGFTTDNEKKYSPTTFIGSNIHDNVCHSNRIHNRSHIFTDDIRIKEEEEEKKNLLLYIPDMENEKECIFATKVCIISWFRFNPKHVKDVENIEKSFILEELCDSMDTIDTIFLKHYRRGNKIEPPILVRLGRLTFIFDINHSKIQVYETGVFQKAYFIWISLLLKYRFIKQEAVHEKTVNIVKSILLKI
jgi:hypothetical protein